MNRTDVEHLLEAATLAYDRALLDYDAAKEHNPWFSPASRHIMIDGSRDIIDRGYHREAVFWVMTSHIVAASELKASAPEEYERTWRTSYQHLLDTLEIGSPEALAEKGAQIEELLCRTMAVVEDILRRERS
jgi:hypothetical protein